MSKVGDWFFEKFLTLLLSGSSMILNTSPIKKKLAEVLTQKINEQIGTDNCSVSFNELKINSHDCFREISANGTFTISDADIKKLIKQNKG
ncbi:MAG: hypothetical protein II258_06005 [Spirochaetales bacterium]|nr:hypothetical protein [Spirochaetales bacterium]